MYLFRKYGALLATLLVFAVLALVAVIAWYGFSGRHLPLIGDLFSFVSYRLTCLFL